MKNIIAFREGGFLLTLAWFLLLFVTGCATRLTESLHQVPGEQCTVGDYQVHLYRYPHGGGYIEISRGDNVVYSAFSRKGGYYIGGETGSLDEMDHPTQVLPGTDLTGNGEPDVIIAHWEHDPEYNYTDYIIELSNRPKLIAKINGGPNPFYYKDNPTNDEYTISMRDSCLLCFSPLIEETAAPEVILKYTASCFHVAPDLMKAPLPPQEELDSAKERIRKELAGDAKAMEVAQSELLQVMFQLMYSGHERQAYEFFDACWPSNVQGRERFRSKIKSALRKSSYWAEIEQSNR